MQHKKSDHGKPSPLRGYFVQYNFLKLHQIYAKIYDAKWLMLVSGSLGFTVFQPSKLCYPIVVSNPIVQIRVDLILINHHALFNALNAL